MKDGVTDDHGRSPAERFVAESLDDPRSAGRPFSDRARLTRRSLEDYLKAGMRPRWMERLIEIERGDRRAERERLARASTAALQRGVRRRPARGSPSAGVRSRGRCRFDELNELIRTHNEWYPVERDLPMDLRTRDYVLINGRSYRRPRARPGVGAGALPSAVARAHARENGKGRPSGRPFSCSLR